MELKNLIDLQKFLDMLEKSRKPTQNHSKSSKVGAARGTRFAPLVTALGEEDNMGPSWMPCQFCENRRGLPHNELSHRF